MKASALPLLVCIAILRAACAHAAPLPDFSRYQDNEAWQSRIAEHTSGQFFCLRITVPQSKPHELPKHEDLLLGITVFYRDHARSALRYMVTPTGTAHNCRDIHSWAIQDSHSKQLSARQLSDLKAAIKRLPDRDAYPPLNELAIVSFRLDADWTTHTMPTSELKPILAIIGERSETKKSQ